MLSRREFLAGVAGVAASPQMQGRAEAAMCDARWGASTINGVLIRVSQAINGWSDPVEAPRFDCTDIVRWLGDHGRQLADVAELIYGARPPWTPPESRGNPNAWDWLDQQAVQFADVAAWAVLRERNMGGDAFPQDVRGGPAQAWLAGSGERFLSDAAVLKRHACETTLRAEERGARYIGWYQEQSGAFARIQASEWREWFGWMLSRFLADFASMRSWWQERPGQRAIRLSGDIRLSRLASKARRCDLAGLVARWADENGRRTLANWHDLEYDIDVQVSPTLHLFARKRSPGSWSGGRGMIPGRPSEKCIALAESDDLGLMVGLAERATQDARHTMPPPGETEDLEPVPGPPSKTAGRASHQQEDDSP